MVYYQDNDVLIRDLRESDARVITDEEIAQGWQADIEKYRMRLRHQAEGKATTLVAEYRHHIAGFLKVAEAMNAQGIV